MSGPVVAGGKESMRDEEKSERGVGEEKWNKAERGETPMQSQDRHYAELLQELRVVQTGMRVQRIRARPSAWWGGSC
jgi:Family of unknown function (DUF6328)